MKDKLISFRVSEKIKKEFIESAKKEGLQTVSAYIIFLHTNNKNK